MIVIIAMFISPVAKTLHRMSLDDDDDEQIIMYSGRQQHTHR